MVSQVAGHCCVLWRIMITYRPESRKGIHRSAGWLCGCQHSQSPSSKSFEYLAQHREKAFSTGVKRAGRSSSVTPGGFGPRGLFPLVDPRHFEPRLGFEAEPGRCMACICAYLQVNIRVARLQSFSFKLWANLPNPPCFSIPLMDDYSRSLQLTELPRRMCTVSIPLAICKTNSAGMRIQDRGKDGGGDYLGIFPRMRNLISWIELKLLLTDRF